MMNIAAQNAARLEIYLAPLVDAMIAINPPQATIVGGLAPMMARHLRATAYALPAPEGEAWCDTHRRVPIFWSAEGYSGSALCAVHFGYCDTIDAIKSEIDDYFSEEAAYYGDATPLDTPSIDTSFHTHEMDV